MKRNFFILFFIFIWINSIFSQTPTNTCGCTNVPTWIVDLSSKTDSTWRLTPPNRTATSVCGTGKDAEDKCWLFKLTLNEFSDKLTFTYTKPGKASQFHVMGSGLDTIIDAGAPLCVSGTGPFCVTYCKSGNDGGDIIIKAEQSIKASPDVTITSACSTKLSIASTVIESSVNWQVVASSISGYDYNTYLTCTSGCYTTYLDPRRNASIPMPTYVIVKVYANYVNDCNKVFPTEDYIRVDFVNEKKLTITRCSPYFPTKLIPYLENGAPPISYEWSWIEGGITKYAYTDTITAKTSGLYHLKVSDLTTAAGCGTYEEDIDLSSSQILQAEAGDPIYNCNNRFSITPVQLNGKNTSTPYAKWSGGNGTYSNINNDTTQYTPTAAEIIAGSVKLYLTASSGDVSCGSHKDSVMVYFSEPKTPVTTNLKICQGSPLTLTASSGVSYLWNTLQTTQSITVNPSISSTYTVQIFDGCTRTDVYNVSVTPKPIADVIGTTTGCYEKAYNVLATNVTVTNDSLILWKLDPLAGSGILSGASSKTPSYVPQGADSARGYAKLILTVQGKYPCSALASDTLTLNFKYAKTKTVNLPSICEGDSVKLPDNSYIKKAGTYKRIYGAFNGCDSIVSYILALKPVDTVYITKNVCGPTYTLPDGKTASTNGTYISKINSFLGCDSFIISNLTFIDPPTVFAGPDATICSYNSFTNSLSSVSANRESFSWSIVGSGSFVNNTILHPTYNAVDPTAKGKVSLVLTAKGIAPCMYYRDTMVLTLNPRKDTSIITTLCEGDSLLLPDKITYVKAVGTYTRTILTKAGCDSIVKITISEIKPKYTSDTVRINVCSASYTLPDGTIVSSIGTYLSTLKSQFQCDSVIITKLNLVPPVIVDAGPDVSACLNNTFLITQATASNYSSINWTTTGKGSLQSGTTLNPTYTPSLADSGKSISFYINLLGKSLCPSKVDSFKLNFKYRSFHTKNDVACQGRPYLLPNNTTVYPVTSTTYSLVLNNAAGCDSFLTIKLKVNPLKTTSKNVSICKGSTYVLPGGKIVSLAGTYKDTLSTYLGCDSIITTNITVIDPPLISLGFTNVSLCVGDPLTISGVTALNYDSIKWNTSGTGIFSDKKLANPIYYTATDDTTKTIILGLTAYGKSPCPAKTSNITLKYYYRKSTVVNAAVCQYQTYKLPDGRVINTAGTYYSNLKTWAGCDSIVISKVTIYPVYSFINKPSICSNETYSLPDGTKVNTEGTYVQNPKSVFGCDSIITTILSVTPAPIIDAGPSMAEICFDEPFYLSSSSVSNAKSYQWSSSWYGVFSTVLKPYYNPGLSDSIKKSTTLKLTAQGNSPCKAVSDSIKLSFNFKSIKYDNANICQGKSYRLPNDSIVFTEGSYVSRLFSKKTCDSLIITKVNVYPPIKDTITDYLCQGLLYDLPDGRKVNGLDSVYYTVKIVSKYGCPITYFYKLKVVPSPIASVKDLDSTCYNRPYKITHASAKNELKIEWTKVSGMGFLTNPNTLTPVYTPVQAEMGNTVVLALTVYGLGNCVAAKDTFHLKITGYATVDAGGPYTVCENNASVMLSGITNPPTGSVYWSLGSSDGTFSPTDTLRNNIFYEAGNNDISNKQAKLFLNFNSVCGIIKDSLLITYTNAPIVVVQDSAIVCESQTAIKISGNVSGNTTTGIWRIDPSIPVKGTFSPSATSLITNYLPSSSEKNAGFTRLILSSTNYGSCRPVSDTLNIRIQKMPVIDILGDDTACNGRDISLMIKFNGGTGQGTWSSDNGSGSFSSNSNDSVVYSPSIDDRNLDSLVFRYTPKSDNICYPGAITKIIRLLSPTLLNAWAEKDSICSNNAFVNLHSTIIQGATKGEWTSNATGNFFASSSISNPYFQLADTSARKINFVYAAMDGCSNEKDSFTVKVYPAPKVFAGNKMFVCKGTSSVLLNGSVTGITNKGFWKTLGNGTFSDANLLKPVYYFGSADTSFVDLVLFSSNHLDCNSTSDTLRIYFTAIPTVDAGQDASSTICANDSIELNGSIKGTFQTGIWTSTGTGNFYPSDTSLHAFYIPSLADTTKNYIILRLTSTQSCKAISDEFQAKILEAPEVTALQDTLKKCESISSVTLSASSKTSWALPLSWNTNGNGTFSSSNATGTSIVYTPTPADISKGYINLTVKTTNNRSCKPSTDDVILYIERKPIVEAGPLQTICSNDSVRLNGSITFGNGKGNWTMPFGNNGSFYPVSYLMNTKYKLGSSDPNIFYLKLTSDSTGVCPQNFDSIEIHVKPGPEIIIEKSAVVCENNGVLTISGTINNATGGKWSSLGDGNFSFADTIISNIYNASPSELLNKNFELRLSSRGSDCPATTAILPVTVSPAPKVYAGDDQYICKGTSIANLFGSINPSSSKAIWKELNPSISDGILYNDTNYTASSYVFGVDDNKRLSVDLILETRNDKLCKPVRDTLVLKITDVPDVDAGQDITACANNKEILLKGTISGKPGTGIWSRNDGNPANFYPSSDSINTIYQVIPSDTINKFVELLLTSTNACVVKNDVLKVNFITAPSVNIGKDTILCESASSIKLNASIKGGSWKSKYGNNDFYPSIFEANPIYNFSAFEKNSGSSYLMYSFNNGYCDNISDTIYINFNKKPVVTLVTPDTSCIGIDIPISVNVKWGNGKGYWFAKGSFTDSLAKSTNYIPSTIENSSSLAKVQYSTISDGYCDPVLSSTNIVLKQLPIVNAGTDFEICANNPIINLEAKILQGANKGRWTKSGSGYFTALDTSRKIKYIPSIIDLKTDSLIFNFKTSDACDDISDTIIVKIGPAPKVDAGPTVYVCRGETTAKLNASITGPAKLGTWSTRGTGTFSNRFSLKASYYMSKEDTAAGKVTLLLTSYDNGNCLEVVDSVNIIVTGKPTIDAGADQLICANDSAWLNGKISDNTKGKWSTSGKGKFIPSDTSARAGYVPDLSDTSIIGGVKIIYRLIESCISDTDFLTIRFKPTPVVTIASVNAICEDVNTVKNINASGTVWAYSLNWRTTGNGIITSLNSQNLSIDYKTGSQDISRGFAQLIVSTNPLLACKAIDTLEFKIIKLPQAIAGTEDSICNTENAPILGIIKGGTGKGIWSILNGDGNFLKKDTSLANTYTPGTNDKISGIAWLKLVSTFDGICRSDSDSIKINLVPNPQALVLTPDTSICYSSGKVYLQATVKNATGGYWFAGGGSFIPSAKSLIANYFPTKAELNSSNFKVNFVTISNVCTPDTAQKNVNILPRPYINAGEDQIICTGITSVELKGIVQNNKGKWRSIGDGTNNPLYNSGKFLKPDTLLNNFYNLSSDDTARKIVYLVLESRDNGICDMVTDTLVIKITSIPKVFAGNDFTVCANNPNVELKGLVKGGSGKGNWAILNAGGTFAPENKDTCIYIPGIRDTSNRKIYLKLSALESCRNISDTLVVNIYPTPKIDAGIDQFYCNTVQTINLIGKSSSLSPYSGTYTWSGNGSGIISNSLTLNKASYAVLAKDIESDSLRFTLTLSKYRQCKNISDTSLVFFKSAPTAQIALPRALCLNTLAVFRDSSKVPHGKIVSYSWEIDGKPFSDSVVPVTFNSVGYKNVKLNITTDKQCSSSIDKTIYIRALPNPRFEATPQFCSNSTIYFKGSPDSLPKWEWNFGNGNNGTGIKPSGQLYTKPGNYTIRYKATDAYGCADSVSNVINIKPNPNADFILDRICYGNTTTFRNKSTISGDVITKYSWDFGDGNSSSVKNPNHTYMTLKDTVLITLVAMTATCNDTFVRAEECKVTKPVIHASTTSGCSPLEVNFWSNVDFTGGEVFYTWRFDNSVTSFEEKPTYKFINNTTTVKKIWVKLEINAYCDVKDSVEISVAPSPLISISSSKENVCSGDSITFTKTSTNANSYEWYVNNKLVSKTYSNSLNIPFRNQQVSNQFQEVKLLALSNNGCTATAFKTILVYGIPQNTITSKDTACHDESIKIDAAAGGSSYQWNYGDKKTEIAGSTVYHSFKNLSLNDTAYKLQLIFKNQQGCTDTTQKSIIIRPAPNTIFSFDTTQGCTPLSIKMTDLTKGTIISRKWNFSTGDSIMNLLTVNKTFINPDTLQKTFTASLSVTNQFGCKAVSVNSFNVYPLPIANFEYKKQGCTPLTIEFKNQSTLNATSFEWNLDGNVSKNINPKHTFINDGNTNISKSVSLTSISAYGCRSLKKTINDIVVFPGPKGAFAVDKSGGCSPHTVNFTNKSIGAVKYNWIFGDGSNILETTNKDIPISNTYRNIQKTIAKYKSVLIAQSSNGCTDTIPQTIEVYPAIESKFESDTIGCSPAEITFKADTTLGATFYSWSFDDGNNSSSPSTKNTYNNLDKTARIYRAKLVTLSEYYCSDTSFKDITIYPKPKATFFISQNSGCNPFDVILVDSTKLVDSYIWDYGDGFQDTTSVFIHTHKYENPGKELVEYNLRLMVMADGDCTDTLQHTITVYPSVKASFSPDTASCTPLNIDFVNSSDKVIKYRWEFGDNAKSGLENPSHTFLNSSVEDTTYHVQLTIESHYGCKDTASKYYKVYAVPDPDFALNPTYMVLPNANVKIENITPGKSNWKYDWDFGDGMKISDVTEPYGYEYKKWGSYIIILKAYDEQCNDTVKHTVTIVSGKPIAKYDSDSAFSGCVPHTMTFINQSKGADWFLWKFGDGAAVESDTIEDIIYTYKQPGKYLVELMAMTLTDTTIVSDKYVTVYPKPLPFFHVAPQIVEAFKEMKCINVTSNAVRYFWEFGDGKTDTVAEPFHIYSDEGKYDITLYAWTEYECTDTITIKDAIEVEPGCRIILPNAFTPSKTGASGGKYNLDAKETTNDIFHPITKNIVNYQLEIYSRWGELLFVSKDISIGWDGYFKNVLVKDDVYIWKVKGVCFNGKEIVETGTVIVIR